MYSRLPFYLTVVVALLEAKLLGDLLLGGLVRLDVQLVQNGQGGLNNKQIIFLKIFYWVFNTFGTSAVLRTIGLAGTRTPASADAGCYLASNNLFQGQVLLHFDSEEQTFCYRSLNTLWYCRLSGS